MGFTWFTREPAQISTSSFSKTKWRIEIGKKKEKGKDNEEQTKL